MWLDEFYGLSILLLTRFVRSHRILLTLLILCLIHLSGFQNSRLSSLAAQPHGSCVDNCKHTCDPHYHSIQAINTCMYMHVQSLSKHSENHRTRNSSYGSSIDLCCGGTLLLEHLCALCRTKICRSICRTKKPAAPIEAKQEHPSCVDNCNCTCVLN